MKIFNSILFGTLLITLGANVVSAAEYYCSQNPNMYSTDFIYDTSKNAEAKCEWLKESFFAKNNPNGYSNCLTNYKKLQTEYSQGKCTQILSKTYTKGNSKCTVQYFNRDTKLEKVSTSCMGNRDSIKALKSEIDKIYR